MRKWQRVALTVALTATSAGGVALAGVAANAEPGNAISRPRARRGQPAGGGDIPR
jgi:hypothetical protein